MGNNLLGWQTSRVYISKHLSSLSTIGSTTTGNHRNPSLMSLNPLAPAFLPQYQSSSDIPISSSHPNTMNLPLAQLICGMPPPNIPPLDPSTNQPLTDSTSLLSFFPTDISDYAGCISSYNNPRIFNPLALITPTPDEMSPDN